MSDPAQDVTPEERAAALRERFHVSLKSTLVTEAIAAEIRSASEAARKAALEEAQRAMCEFCREGTEPVWWDEDFEKFMHHHPVRPGAQEWFLHDCDASPIRALAARSEAQEKQGEGK